MTKRFENLRQLCHVQLLQSTLMMGDAEALLFSTGKLKTGGHSRTYEPCIKAKVPISYEPIEQTLKGLQIVKQLMFYRNDHYKQIGPNKTQYCRMFNPLHTNKKVKS